MIARELIFLGKKVIIKGPHSLTLFPTEPIRALDAGLLSSGDKGPGGFIKAGFSTPELVAAARKRDYWYSRNAIRINLDGLGSDEWRKKKKAGLGNKSFGHHMERSNSGSLLVQNLDKDPGATGATGSHGESPVTPPPTAQGPPGHCGLANPRRFHRRAGGKCLWRGDRRNRGTRYQRSQLGRHLPVLSPAPKHFTFLSTADRRAGRNRRSRWLPSAGGQRRTGRTRAECPCPQNSGNGGKGGRGGKGSLGGLGGRGGPGADGGQGGIINLTLTCHTGSYVTEVAGGGPGQPGMPGQNSGGGAPGEGGDPGEGKKNILCLSLGGNDGPPGQAGLPGENNLSVAEHGELGVAGPAGQVNITTVSCAQSGCGSGRSLELQ